MKPKLSVATALATQLAALKPVAAPAPEEKIFPDAGQKKRFQLLLKLDDRDVAALNKILAVGRSAGRATFGATQAIRVALRSAKPDVALIDAVLAEDPRRKRRRKNALALSAARARPDQFNR